MNVDDFVDAKVLPEFRPVVAAIRSLMKETAPGAKEVISYGIPMYVQKLPLAWISPNKSGITLGFMRGVGFEDKYGLLRGVAKHARHIKVRNLEDVNKPAFKYYIKQALKFDKL
jgi:hypothetical protein